MTLDEFKRLADAGDSPAEGMCALLKALWLDAQGDWDGAHRLAQESPGVDGSWVHAYLHRKEGDAGNALYWYERAGRGYCGGSLQEEWGQIARSLLGEASHGR
jgi:hypothetical protein